MSDFTINFISMKEYGSQEVMWEQNDDWNSDHIVEARIPKEILQCRAVSRTVNFSVSSEIEHLKLQQIVKLYGEVIERWEYDFGFVMPNSTNDWEQVIDAAPPEDILPVDVLSGNIVIETLFYNNDAIIKRSRVKLIYV